MDARISSSAEAELDSLDQSMRKLFFAHIEKILAIPPRRHLRFGIPFNVENVTKQARLIYHIENEVLHVLHCFGTHKEYERWYKSYK